MMNAKVESVFKSDTHTMQKFQQPSIQLLEGLGVQGDAHMGVTVKHRSRVAADPTQPNLRQVHLIHTELHDELNARGFQVHAGAMGENITTRGIDLLRLPKGTKMFLGETAMLEITGLRNPCLQLEGLQTGLMEAVLDHDGAGNLIRKAGIMGVVLTGGEVKPGDEIRVELPPLPHEKLERV
jgi:MOSC domain-containing protein YiiM